MAKTLQVRDVEDDVYARLVLRAAEDGLSVPEMLRRELRLLADRPSLSSWLRETRSRSSDVASREVLDALDQLRGPWPDADAGR